MNDRHEGVVLLDVPPGAAGQFDRDVLEHTGHPVLVCHGPTTEEPCPLLAGQHCPMFDRAHGVVFELDLDDDQHRRVLHRYRELAREGLPIRVVVTPEDARRHQDLLDDVEVWTHDPTVADLDGFAARVEAADRLS